MRFDLTDLRLFLAVADAGSITHGAAAMNLSTTAASERIRDMELSGGLSLLARGRRGAVPTQAGEILANHARSILRQAGAMQAELTTHGLGMRSTVRLFANTAAISEYLPGHMGAWLSANPQIDIDLKERQSTDIVKAITTGVGDIGIVSDATITGALVTRPFAIDRLVLAVSHDHALAKEAQVSFIQILDEPYIGFSGALQDHIDGHAMRLGRQLRPRVTVRSFDGICALVSSGGGVGIIPETAARRCAQDLPISFVRLVDGWSVRRLLLCFRPDETLHAAAQRLLDHLSS